MSSLRKQQRLRREYLHHRSNELQAKATHERKNKLLKIIEKGSDLPGDFKQDEGKLREKAKWEDAETGKLRTHADDEYASAGVKEPKICVTTSRDPSSKLKEFSKEIKMIFPTAVRINRGQTTVKELVESCRAADFSDIVLITEHRGVPDGLIVSHLPYGPTARFSLFDCVTRHDIGKEAAGNASEAFPHLIFEDMNSPLGQRFQDILKYLFPVPKTDSKRIMTFYNNSDVISFRHHLLNENAITGDKKKSSIELVEIGPSKYIYICIMI